MIVGCFSPELNEEVVRPEWDGSNLEPGKRWNSGLFGDLMGS